MSAIIYGLAIIYVGCGGFVFLMHANTPVTFGYRVLRSVLWPIFIATRGSLP